MKTLQLTPQKNKTMFKQASKSIFICQFEKILLDDILNLLKRIKKIFIE